MIDVIARTASNPMVSGVLFATGLALVGLWLAAAWWTFLDISRRTESELARLLAPAWVVVSSPLMLPLSLAVYTLVRPQQTVDDRRSRARVAALAPALAHGTVCHGCGQRAEEEWRRCPSCATWLQAPCAHCGGWSDVELELCPWCGSDVLDLPRVASPHELASITAGIGIAPGRPAVAVASVTAVSMADDPGDAHASAMHGAAAALVSHAAATGLVGEASMLDDGHEASEAPQVIEGHARRLPSPRRPRTPRRRATGEAPGPRRVRRSGSGEGTGGRSSASRAKQ